MKTNFLYMWSSHISVFLHFIDKFVQLEHKSSELVMHNILDEFTENRDIALDSGLIS